MERELFLGLSIRPERYHPPIAEAPISQRLLGDVIRPGDSDNGEKDPGPKPKANRGLEFFDD
ncbi:hypothetical protein [Palleronia sp.]|uniref:hypothetical protein n=1 Tax=Palleronia sp. TaxID=1940284 RepID=UPI0035C870AF